MTDRTRLMGPRLGHRLAGAAGRSFRARTARWRILARLAWIPPCAALTFVPVASGQLAGSISGTNFHDLNQDGVRDLDEPGLANWDVFLSGPVNTWTQTDSLGVYLFPNLPFGTYTVSVEQRPGWTQTFPPPPGEWTVAVTPAQPVRSGIDFGNWSAQCRLEYEWRRGPPIVIEKPLDWWPKGAQLDKMRPGDVIAITIGASDSDWLVQTCHDCGEGFVSRKWGPYPDRMLYNWTLTEGHPGQLILPSHPEKTTILYQIPRCGWATTPATQSATITLEIANDPGGLKVVDPPLLGTSITFNMEKDCGPVPGWIKVSVVTTPAIPGEPENIPDLDVGTCLPQPPVWRPASPINKPSIVTTEPMDLCPDYGLLLSADATDLDEVELNCVDPSPLCAPTKANLSTADPIRYTWTRSGAGEFPLGSTGPVVFFRRSRSQGAMVKCALIQDSGAQAVDLAEEAGPRFILRAKKPKAFVGIGEASAWYGARIIDLERAAEKAKDKFEAAGYEVEHNPSATIADVESAIWTSCYQALWITGHGKEGQIYMLQPPFPNNFRSIGMGITSLLMWGCSQSPFIRELTLLGCNTFDATWTDPMVCGYANTFNYRLYPNIAGQVMGRNPLIWEINHHSPPAPHNLSAQ